jgi:hypothetical protein
LGYNSGVRSAEIAHERLVKQAVNWLRRAYGCSIVLSEQYCASGEVPDAIGWKKKCHSVVVECKASRSDFLADATKPFRLKPEEGLGCERFYLAPCGLIRVQELPRHWGLLESKRGRIDMLVKPARKELRSPIGLLKEMNLLLASLRRVEVRIQPQAITDFLKWKNRLAAYNGGRLPSGVVSLEDEENAYALHSEKREAQPPDPVS